jgi:hypothetical protein
MAVVFGLRSKKHPLLEEAIFHLNHFFMQNKPYIRDQQGR